MTRSMLPIVLVAALAACDRNPEGSSRGEPVTARKPGKGSGQLPPGHPPAEQKLPQGHPPVGNTPSGPNAPTGEPGEPAAGGIAWEVPDAFEAEPPSSRMRAAQYRVPGGDGEQDAELVAYYFGAGQGGSVQDNIDRWVGQFESPEGAETDKREVNDMTVTVVDVSGTYQGMQMPGQPSQAAQPDQRMLAAIVEGPKGPVFFKMVGPQSVIEGAEPGFEELIDSVEAR